MNRAKFIVLALLISLGLIISVDGCNRIKTKQADVAKESVSDTSSQKPIQETPLQQQDIANKSETADNNPSIASLRNYTRENPFVPLISDRTTTKPIPQENKEDKKIVASAKIQDNKPITRDITVNLLSVIGGTTALFSEDGQTRVLSIGDSIADMRVLEMGDDNVILIKDSKKYKIKTGEQLKTTVTILK
jgi:hypothetical protein